MKKLLLFMCLMASVQFYAQDNRIELKGEQSMGITGQGPGRDGAINPYYGEDCIAVVKNLGKTTFDTRVKDKEGTITITPIPAGKSKKITLLRGSILYYDSTEGAMTDVTFVKMEPNKKKSSKF